MQLLVKVISIFARAKKKLLIKIYSFGKNQNH